MEPGTFYALGEGFFLPLKSLPFQTKIQIKSRLSVSCMFDIYLADVNNERLGFYFTGRFEIKNRGGYLITSMQNKGLANEADILIKTEDLVVYNFPNRGTMAISPLVSPEIETIFDEQ
jgi:hypothetical protein